MKMFKYAIMLCVSMFAAPLFGAPQDPGVVKDLAAKKCCDALESLYGGGLQGGRDLEQAINDTFTQGFLNKLCCQTLSAADREMLSKVFLDIHNYTCVNNSDYYRNLYKENLNRDLQKLSIKTINRITAVFIAIKKEINAYRTDLHATTCQRITKKLKLAALLAIVAIAGGIAYGERGCNSQYKWDRGCGLYGSGRGPVIGGLNSAGTFVGGFAHNQCQKFDTCRNFNGTQAWEGYVAPANFVKDRLQNGLIKAREALSSYTPSTRHTGLDQDSCTKEYTIISPAIVTDLGNSTEPCVAQPNLYTKLDEICIATPAPAQATDLGNSTEPCVAQPNLYTKLDEICPATAEELKKQQDDASAIEGHKRQQELLAEQQYLVGQQLATNFSRTNCPVTATAKLDQKNIGENDKPEPQETYAQAIRFVLKNPFNNIHWVLNKGLDWFGFDSKERLCEQAGTPCPESRE